MVSWTDVPPRNSILGLDKRLLRENSRGVSVRQKRIASVYGLCQGLKATHLETNLWGTVDSRWCSPRGIGFAMMVPCVSDCKANVNRTFAVASSMHSTLDPPHLTIGSTRALDKKLRFERDSPIEMSAQQVYGRSFLMSFTWRLRFIRIPYSPFTSKHRVTWTTPEFEFVSLPFQWSFCCFLHGKSVRPCDR
jgi:hypothetical protein